jgi:hypothetical protein
MAECHAERVLQLAAVTVSRQPDDQDASEHRLDATWSDALEAAGPKATAAPTWWRSGACPLYCGGWPYVVKAYRCPSAAPT